MQITVEAVDEMIVQLAHTESGALMQSMAVGLEPDKWASLTVQLLEKMHGDFTKALLAEHPDASIPDVMAHTAPEALMNFALVMLSVGYRMGTTDCSGASTESVDDAIKRILGA